MKIFKILKGGKLIFLKDKEKFVLEADDTQLESGFSNMSNSWMTTNYSMSKKGIEYVKKKEFNELHFEFKKKVISFNVIK